MTYYSYASQLVAGTIAKADDVNARFLAVQTSFALVEVDMNRAVRTTSGTLTPISAAAGTRAKALLMFDAAGDITFGNSLLKDLDAGGFKLTGLADPTNNGDAVCLRYLNTYSGSLAGVPSIAGQNGKVLFTDGVTLSWNNSVLLPPQATNAGKFLTTDATNPSWVNISQVSAIGSDRGGMLLHDGTNYSWALPRGNRLRNASGADGTSDWTATAVTVTAEAATSSNGASYAGYHFKNTGVVTTTGDFSSEFIPAGVSESWTVSAEILTQAISAGSMQLVVEFYTAGFASISSVTAALTQNTDRRYSVTGVAPLLTAFVRLRVKWLAATAGEVRIRRAKVEQNSYATPFNNDAMVNWLVAPRATYLINTQATISENYRSAAGVQAFDTQFQYSGGVSGTQGKGVLTITNLRTAFVGVLGFSSENSLGNSGAAITVDLGLFQYQKMTVNANVTITVTAPAQVQKNQLKLVCDATLRTIAWAGSAITWLGGSSPAFSAINKTIFVTTYYDGTGLWGSWTEA